MSLSRKATADEIFEFYTRLIQVIVAIHLHGADF